MAPDQKNAPCLTDFPRDIQLNILSFLHPMKIFSLATTCRSFSLICSRSTPSTDLWFAICDRRWGSKTQINLWPTVPSHQFYKTLDRWDRLIGFWYHRGKSMAGTPSVIFFEWSSSRIIGSTISPYSSSASYSVRKIPFISLSLSADCEIVSYVHPDDPDTDPIPVSVKFINGNRFVLDAISENTMGAEKSSKKHVKKMIMGQKRRSWDSETFLKISCYSPTATRPLQGLWKGITKEMNLEFFLVTDTDYRFITYEKLLNRSPSRIPRFWTNGDMLMNPPFSIEEQSIYNTMEHIISDDSAHHNMDIENITQIIMISDDNPDRVGRVWQYKDGMFGFGFGFLASNFIVDLKLLAQDGHLLDVVE